MLSEKSLKKFKAIYKDKYAMKISDAEATRLAINLLCLYKTMYQQHDNKPILTIKKTEVIGKSSEKIN